MLYGSADEHPGQNKPGSNSDRDSEGKDPFVLAGGAGSCRGSPPFVQEPPLGGGDAAGEGAGHHQHDGHHQGANGSQTEGREDHQRAEPGSQSGQEFHVSHAAAAENPGQNQQGEADREGPGPRNRSRRRLEGEQARAAMADWDREPVRGLSWCGNQSPQQPG